MLKRATPKLRNSSFRQTFSRATFPLYLGGHKSEPQRCRLFPRTDNHNEPHSLKMLEEGPMLHNAVPLLKSWGRKLLPH